MTRCLTVIILLMYQVSYTQVNSKPVFIIVHGAWGGSWAFKKIDSLLTEKGCTVYRPSLTGQGERAHLASSIIGLSTQINDVVNMILYEDLHEVVLIGHSYGGMIITGVSDSLPTRIKKLIYVDAFVPENGESVFDIWVSKREALKKMIVDGFMVPSWVRSDKTPPMDVPQSVKTFTDAIKLNNSARLQIPTTYILTVAKGSNANDDDFAPQAQRASSKHWPVLQLEADHNPQWSAPEMLTKMLYNIGTAY